MNDRFLYCFLHAVLLIACCLSVCNATIFRITDLDSFTDFVTSIESFQKEDVVILEENLDFQEDPEPFPLGMSRGGDCTPFSGTFNGGNKTLKRVVTRSDFGGAFFCELKDAVVENLIFDETCSFSSSDDAAASVAVNARGNVRIENVVNKGTVMGVSVASGFVANLVGDNSHIEFKNCHNMGSVSARASRSNHASGFLGIVQGLSDPFIAFNGCANYGEISCSSNQISGAPCTGGFISSIVRCEGSSIGISNSFNNGSINTTAAKSNINAGGFIGEIHSNTGVRLSLDGSSNYGNIDARCSEKYPFCLGGFIGKMESCSDVSVNVSQCMNTGTIKSSSRSDLYVGGFFGRIHETNSSSLKLLDCSNLGAFTGETASSNDGGCTGRVENCGYTTMVIHSFINNCTMNTHALSSSFCGGVLGIVEDNNNFVLSVDNSESYGEIECSGRGNHIGGILGSASDNEVCDFSFSNCGNKATITLVGILTSAGGTVASLAPGIVDNNYKFLNCRNEGAVVVSSGSTVHTGGVIGHVQKDSANIFMKNCSNSGMINSTQEVKGSAGLIGFVSTGSLTSSLNLSLVDCENDALISSSGMSCGLLCVDLGSALPCDVNLTHCINKGTIVGSRSYGISTFLTWLNGVVSMGNVSGKDFSLLFGNITKSARSLYSLDNSCLQCSDKHNEFFSGKDDPYYYLVSSGSLIRLDNVLNFEAYSGGMGIFWSSNLSLTNKLLVRLHDGGKIRTEFRLYGVPLSDVSLLKECFNSGNCMVLDRYNGVVYGQDTEIVGDFDVITKQAVTVVIELDPIDLKDLNKTEIVQAVSSLTGLEETRMDVQFDTDENGKVVRVLVLVKDEQTALSVVEEVKKISKEERSKCEYGAICRASKVYVMSDFPSIVSHGSVNVLSLVVGIFFGLCCVLLSIE